MLVMLAIYTLVKVFKPEYLQHLNRFRFVPRQLIGKL